jgi:signal transduction histidine kinase
MRSRLRSRATVAAVIAAIAGAAWLGAAAAFSPQPPAVREVLLGAVVVCLCLLIIIGGLAILDAQALRHGDERMRRFLADASHELRTPIAGVQATAETLLRANPDRAGREKLVLQILREAHRAGRLIDDLLAITRLEQGTPMAAELFDLMPLTEAAAEATRELAPSVDVQVHGPGHVQLHGDPAGIRQVLDNLLSNARHATPDGGQITVRVTEHDDIQVEVTDTGPGVPPADRERVFERFTRLNGSYRGRTDGNGLGLAIARNIVTAHSGTLTCVANASQGARFHIRLPRPH